MKSAVYVILRADATYWSGEEWTREVDRVKTYASLADAECVARELRRGGFLNVTITKAVKEPAMAEHK